MSSSADVVTLIRRYLAACELAYPAARRNGDTELADLIARSAYTTALNVSGEIGPQSALELAVPWVERIMSVYPDDDKPTDIRRSLKWACQTMISLSADVGEKASQPHKTQSSTEKDAIADE